jgi:hypothetical protein
VLEGASITRIASAAARRRGLGGGAARRGEKFQRGAFLRLHQPMPRAEAGAQILVPRIGQTGPHPKKIWSAAPYAAPAGGTLLRSGAAYRRFI